MNVCMITGSFPNLPCGVGDYTYRLAKALSGRGTDIHILTSKRPEIVTDSKVLGSVRVHSVVSSWSLLDTPTITRQIRHISPDIVHIQYPANFGKANRKVLANFLGSIARIATVRNAKVVTTLHEFGERRLRWRARAFINIITSDLVICVNRFDVKVVDSLVFHKKPVIHIPLASNIPFIPITLEQRRQMRYSLGIGESDIGLAYFGFITPLKGFDVLLQAVQKLRNTGIPVKLLILTKLRPDQDDYHREMIGLIQHLGIQDVCLLGAEHYSSENISQYLQSADLAVLPFVEGASDRRCSLLAVLHHWLPTITTNGPNVPPDFVDRKNMLLVSPRDPDAVGGATERLIENPGLMKHLADEAGKLSRMFSWDEIAQRTIRSYRLTQEDIGNGAIV